MASKRGKETEQQAQQEAQQGSKARQRAKSPGFTACEEPRLSLCFGPLAARSPCLPRIGFNATISACEKGRQWQLALVIFNSIPTKTLGCFLSFAVSALAPARTPRSQSDRIWPEDQNRKLAPDVISHNAAISSCEKGGNWQLALQFFAAIPQAGHAPDVISSLNLDLQPFYCTFCVFALGANLTY